MDYSYPEHSHSDRTPYPSILSKHATDFVACSIGTGYTAAHLSIGVTELLRILLDEEGLEWLHALEICTKLFSFTNHTVIPKTLEKWPMELFGSLLPRHLQITYNINSHFMEEVKRKYGNDYERLARMSIIEEGNEKDFYGLWPHKFQKKTNGVTPSWLAFCNPGLKGVITKRLGTEAWITNLDLLSGLRKHVHSEELQEEWKQVRRQNKTRLVIYIEGITGVNVGRCPLVCLLYSFVLSAGDVIAKSE